MSGRKSHDEQCNFSTARPNDLPEVLTIGRSDFRAAVVAELMEFFPDPRFDDLSMPESVAWLISDGAFSRAAASMGGEWQEFGFDSERRVVAWRREIEGGIELSFSPPEVDTGSHCEGLEDIEKILSENNDARAKASSEFALAIGVADAPRRALEKALQDKIVSIYPHLNNKVMVHLCDHGA